MQEGVSEFKKYLKEALKDVEWEKNKNIRLRFKASWIILIIETILFPAIFFGVKSKTIELEMYLLVFFIMAYIFTIFFVIISTTMMRTFNKRVSRFNMASLFDQIPKNIYNKYYELVYPDNILKFQGLQPSTKFPRSEAMVFEVNGENIFWDINEHIEFGPNRDLYVFNSLIRVESHYLKNYEPITLLTKNANPKDLYQEKKLKKDEFFSTSIHFNQKYQVFGTNQLQMTRLFDPSVLENFDQSPSYDSYRTNIIKIDNGYAYIRWSNEESRNPWKVNLNKFEYLRLTRTNYVDQITKRIEEDFQRFFDSYNLFRPFDFYRIYQNKN